MFYTKDEEGHIIFESIWSLLGYVVAVTLLGSIIRLLGGMLLGVN